MAPVTIHPLGDGTEADLAPYRTIRLRRELGRVERFVAEGDKVVDRLLASDHVVDSILATERALARIRPLLERRAETIRVFVAGEKLEIDAVTGFRSEDVKAVGRRPRAPSVEELFEGTDAPRLLVALDGLTNAENVGGVVRNAAGFGASGILVGTTTCSPYLTRAIRTSMGTVFGLPVAEGLELATALPALRARGVRTIAAHPAATALPLPDAALDGDVCLVFGAEGAGISPAVLEACDVRVALPMAAGADSLNVGSAAAVFLYEAWRRRRQA